MGKDIYEHTSALRTLYMTSNRCYCGNRRVGWEHDGNFEDIQIYAQGN